MTSVPHFLSATATSAMRRHIQIARAIKPCGVDRDDRSSNEHGVNAFTLKMPGHKLPCLFLGAFFPVGYLHGWDY
jgi:hypothetical protein